MSLFDQFRRGCRLLLPNGITVGRSGLDESPIGHPLGASGARIMTTLVNALEQRGGRYGLQTMCEGGGMANATIIERLG